LASRAILTLESQLSQNLVMPLVDHRDALAGKAAA